MSYLIDTNIISEVRKGARCDAHVSAWYASIADEDLFLSTLVLGEIRKGIERARPRTALTNGLTLVTRNDRDVAGLGATVLNPFKSAGNHRRS